MMGFDDFWAIWPKRVDKKSARRAYEKAVPRLVSHDDLMRMTRELIDKDYRFREKRHILHASTYLNQERWEDEPLPPTRAEVREATPDWARIPRDDNELQAWASRHGYPLAGPHMTYQQYRAFLTQQVHRRTAA